MNKLIFVFFAAFGISFAQDLASVEDTSTARALFGNPKINTNYSDLMLEKNANADSLQPTLNGDLAFNKLVSSMRDFWSIKDLQKGKSLNTKLNVNVIYIDGVKEEAFCDISKTTSADKWELAIGADFVSGSSNIVGAHVKQCLDLTKDSIGYVVTDSAGKTIIVPPKKVLLGFKKNNRQDTSTTDLYMRLNDMETYAYIVDALNWIEPEESPSFWTNGNIFRIVAFALSAASTGLGLWQDSKVASEGKKTGTLYMEALKAGEASDNSGPVYSEQYFAYKENVNGIRRSEKLRNGFYISAGVFALSGAVSFFF